MINKLRTPTLSAILAIFATACMTKDPFTSETHPDQNPTATLVSSLTLASIANYAASSDYKQKQRRQDQDSDHKQYRNSKYYSPKRGVYCSSYQQACYNRKGRYSAKWTRQVYGEDE